MNNMLLKRLYSSSTSNSIKWKSTLIRDEFLNYFKNNLEHTYIRSSPVTPLNDSSTLFVNAGMNQFKGIFLNYYDPPAKKVTNYQKCIRISGKHNDLNTVGHDSYHHTFFEMLGNWSFGDYFKEEACYYAWNLLTKHYGIKENSLYVTYFGGNEKLGLEPDLECKDIWLNIGVAKDKVLPFDINNNFWEMGVCGPCGPSTEIHIDHKNCQSNQFMRVNKGYSDLTELWNLVFIQYERLADGTIIPLPKHHVDTGMGFERLVTLLQGKYSNYDTDLFQPLIKVIEKYTEAPGYKGRFFHDDNNLDSSYRILADHSRMITVALADGTLPEENCNLRRIIRKVINISEKVFKKEKILSELSYVVAGTLGDIYPELQTNLKKVQKIIAFEDDLYKQLRQKSSKEWRKMVENRPELASITEWTAPGLLSAYKYLQSIVKDLKASKTLPGNVCFKLYDTYGLKEETITELAEIESLHFDKEDFKNVLQNVKYQSKIGIDKSNNIALKEYINALENNNVPKTNDILKYEYVFVENSYEFPIIESKILGIIVNGNIILNNENDAVSKGITLNKEDEIGIVLDKTLYYSQEGGQMSDHGIIFLNNLIFQINNVQKKNDYVIHFGKLANIDNIDLNKEIQIGINCRVSIDSDRRKGLMQHHTAAHLLNASMKQIFEAVYPCSSSVLPDSLKCQFNSFGEKLSLEQIKQIEKTINNVIKMNHSVKSKILNSSELLKENCVSLTPGEVYPYTDIRVVEINTPDLKSKETCCGTHVHSTGILKHFCFLNYNSKGSAKFTVRGAVGQLATSAKTTGKNIQQKVLNLKDKLNDEKLEYETFKSISKKIKNEINVINEEAPIPYTIKMECLKQIKDLDKNVWIQAEKQKIAGNAFNAQTWMKVVLEIFNAEYAPIKGYNPLLVSNMKSTNVSNFATKHLLCNAINAAKDFALKNVKTV